jgi:hypothetical protein
MNNEEIDCITQRRIHERIDNQANSNSDNKMILYRSFDFLYSSSNSDNKMILYRSFDFLYSSLMKKDK